MEWMTIYIAGKPGFKEEVTRQLQASRFPSMPGTAENDLLCLFWIDERSSLRDFKKAIGSKAVFKYRLQFYPSLESYLSSQHDEMELVLTDDELQLINRMASWETMNVTYKRSA